MEDTQIVALYWDRNENAIMETQKKYGHYCYTIAYNILHNQQDAEESENDTYLDAWQAIPPALPTILSTFLGKITRRIALDKWKMSVAKKRGGGQVPLSLDELMECIPDQQSIDDKLQAEALATIIDTFLRQLPQEERRIFVCRYWYLDSVSDIARRFGFRAGKVSTMLHRTRQKLRAYLAKEGVYL